MKNCELCQLPARTYCESDMAILCWDCDAKVHGANFLVARHSRSLLCQACQSPTPWKATGEKLGRTFSVCESCVVRNESRDDDDYSQGEGGNDNEFDSDNDELDGDNDSDEDDGGVDFEGDGDNQVVPLSSTTTTPPPPPSSSSSSEEAVSVFNNGHSAVLLKRIRETVSNLRCQDDLGRSSRRRRYSSALTTQAGQSGPDGGATSLSDSWRPLKDRRIDLNRPGSPSEPVIESVMRYRGQDNRIFTYLPTVPTDPSDE